MVHLLLQDAEEVHIKLDINSGSRATLHQETATLYNNIMKEC